MPTPRDGAAFEKLFRAHYAELVGVSARVTNDRALSEDVVQGVYLRFYERGGLERADNPRAYLRRAVVTRTLNAIRDRKRVTHPGGEALSSAVEQPEEEAEPDISGDVKERLHAAIARLPERARLCLVLYRFEGLSYAEIANGLSISPKTVENQLSRALKLLRGYLPRAVALLTAMNTHLLWGIALAIVSHPQ